MTDRTSADQAVVTSLGIVVADVIACAVPEQLAVGQLALVDKILLRAGGCAMNTASVLTRIGVPTRLIGAVGDDDLGRFLENVALQRGIADARLRRTGDLPTSASVVVVHPSGERTFLHQPGSSADLKISDVDLAAMSASRALHIGGALVLPALDGAPMAQLLAAAQSRGMLTCLDTVYDPTGRWDLIAPSLPHTDLFAPGIAEARGITGLDDVQQIARRLREWGAGIVALKLGPDGCYVSAQGVEQHVPSLAVRAIDGTGAGDAFVAGLLYGLLQGWPLPRAARFGNVLGALVTAGLGATDGLRDLSEMLPLI